MCKLKVSLLITTTLIFWVVFSSLGQEKDGRFRAMVLKKSIKDSLFIFDFSKKEDWNETQIKYLGILKSKDGKVFKILSYCWLWGRSPRSTNRILIYNSDNRYLGCYAPDMKGELPVKIERNELIFSVETGDKLKSQSRISFTDGLPDQIEIKGGNFYILQK